MSFFRNGWRLCLWAALVFLAAAMPARAQGDLTAAELGLIAPPDLSSPRAALDALRTSVTQAYDLFAETYDRYLDEPGLFASPEVNARIHTVNLLLRRAIATLDLSGVPAVNRDQTGTEAALLLGEILDRLPDIDLETVPDAAAVEARGLTAWTIPQTDLTIVRLDSGPRAGQFVFSAGSVAGARDLYDAIRLYGGRVESGTDLYRFYTLTPGDLLPPKWLLWIHELPFWARDSIFLGHALWQWTGVLLTVLVLFGGWWLVVRLVRRRVGAPPSQRSFTARLVAPVLLAAVSFLAKWIIVKEINVSGDVLLVAATLLEGLIYLATAWAAYIACAGIGEHIAASPRVDSASIDASLIRVAARVAGIAAAIVIIFIGATEIGLPIYGIVAGLGVGGLALGLAARPTLENLIGGFILYADRPVRVGEFCKFGDKIGTVEEIGLRSTRVRALDRTVITVPNAEFSNMQLVNITRRDRTLLDTVVGLRPETTAAEMHAILEEITALLHADPEVVHDTVRVRFQELGTYSLGIGVRAYVATPHTSEFLKAQERILFAIMKVVEGHGAQLAFLPQLAWQGAEPASGESR